MICPRCEIIITTTIESRNCFFFPADRPQDFQHHQTMSISSARATAVLQVAHFSEGDLYQTPFAHFIKYTPGGVDKHLTMGSNRASLAVKPCFSSKSLFFSPIQRRIQAGLRPSFAATGLIPIIIGRIWRALRTVCFLRRPRDLLGGSVKNTATLLRMPPLIFREVSWATFRFSRGVRSLAVRAYRQFWGHDHFSPKMSKDPLFLPPVLTNTITFDSREKSDWLLQKSS